MRMTRYLTLVSSFLYFIQTFYLRPPTDQGRSLRQNVECLAVLEHIQYDPADPNPPGPPDVWVCEFKNGKAFKLLGLENLPSEIGDELESGVDALTIPSAEVTETSIRIPQGAAVGRQKLDKWQDWYGIGNNGNGNANNIFARENQGSSNRRRLNVVKTAFIVRVIASDGETTANLTRLSDSVFGNGNDPVTLASQYANCSYDDLLFVKVPDTTGISTNITDGAVEVTVGVSTSQGDNVMRNAIIAELKYQFNVDKVPLLADHVLMCMPPGTMNQIACK